MVRLNGWAQVPEITMISNNNLLTTELSSTNLLVPASNEKTFYFKIKLAGL